MTTNTIFHPSFLVHHAINAHSHPLFLVQKMSKDELGFEFETVDISTRKQLLREGIQVCISELFPSTKQIVNILVYFTSGIWQLCQNYQFTEEVVSDICQNTIGFI